MRRGNAPLEWKSDYVFCPLQDYLCNCMLSTYLLHKILAPNVRVETIFTLTRSMHLATPLLFVPLETRRKRTFFHSDYFKYSLWTHDVLLFMLSIIQPDNCLIFLKNAFVYDGNSNVRWLCGVGASKFQRQDLSHAWNIFIKAFELCNGRKHLSGLLPHLQISIIMINRISL